MQKIELSNLSELKTQISSVIKKYKKIDVLINNAGIWEFTVK